MHEEKPRKKQHRGPVKGKRSDVINGVSPCSRRKGLRKARGNFKIPDITGFRGNQENRRRGERFRLVTYDHILT
jgi:hypothetical protein